MVVRGQIQLWCGSARDHRCYSYRECSYIAALLKRRDRSHNLLKLFRKDDLIVPKTSPSHVLCTVINQEAGNTRWLGSLAAKFQQILLYILRPVFILETLSSFEKSPSFLYST